MKSSWIRTASSLGDPATDAPESGAVGHVVASFWRGEQLLFEDVAACSPSDLFVHFSDGSRHRLIEWGVAALFYGGFGRGTYSWTPSERPVPPWIASSKGPPVGTRVVIWADGPRCVWPLHPKLPPS